MNITRKTRSDSKKYTYNGVTKPLREWSEELGVSVKTIKRRLREGRPPDEVFAQDRRIGNDYGSDMRKYFRKLEREAEERRWAKHDSV